MDTSHLRTLLEAVFGLVVIGAAIGLVAKSGKADYAHIAKVLFCVFAAIVVLAMGTGAVVYPDFGRKMLSLVGL